MLSEADTDKALMTALSCQQPDSEKEILGVVDTLTVRTRSDTGLAHQDESNKEMWTYQLLLKATTKAKCTITKTLDHVTCESLQRLDVSSKLI